MSRKTVQDSNVVTTDHS